MRSLTKDEVIVLNQNNVKRFGGNFVSPHNLPQESSLDYLVEIVDAELFGEQMYPTICDKAGGTYTM